ncbi:MAG: HAMP domain-containing histidine kinase [Clostridia bacterium]|jgi:signal transduction histidine kinase|nr:HAMP domain-containing histidine kinase [Clostridia bacterium]
MKLKYKLVISHILMILVPLFIIIFVNNNVLEREDDFILNGKKLITPSTERQFYKKTLIDLNKINEIGELHRKKFETEYKVKVDERINKEKVLEFLIEAEKEVGLEDTGFVITQENDDKLIYISPTLKEHTDEVLKVVKNEDHHYLNFNERYVILLKSESDYDVKFYYVGDTKYAKKSISEFKMTAFIILVLILFSINGLLSYAVSRTVTVPLKKIQKSLDEVRAGNLDHKVELECYDQEVGELAYAVDALRIRLKEHKDIRCKYESERKELISNISHDLKTPVTAIKGYAAGIKEGVADTPEKADKYMDVIYKRAEDMEKLVNELATLTKLDFNNMEFNMKKFDFIRYINDAVEEFKFDVEQVGGEISLKVNAKEAIIYGDVDKINRVMSNIIDNAIKYRSNKDLKLDIKVKDTKEKIIISISDNGIGIDDEKLKKIFDRFFRADESRNPSIKGHGIGLSICKRIINTHKGEIYAESKKGTAIIIKLPKEANDEKNIDSRR